MYAKLLYKLLFQLTKRLATGRKVRVSNSGGGKRLYFPHTQIIPALSPTKPPAQWVPALISGGKAAGAWRSTSNSI